MIPNIYISGKTIRLEDYGNKEPEKVLARMLGGKQAEFQYTDISIPHVAEFECIGIYFRIDRIVRSRDENEGIYTKFEVNQEDWKDFVALIHRVFGNRLPGQRMYWDERIARSNKPEFI